MISAEKAIQKIQNKKLKEEQEREEIAKLQKLMEEGKYTPESKYTIDDVEKEINQAIKRGATQFQIRFKLKDDVVKQLKEKGYHCFLLRRTDEYMTYTAVGKYEKQKVVTIVTLVSMYRDANFSCISADEITRL